MPTWRRHGLQAFIDKPSANGTATARAPSMDLGTDFAFFGDGLVEMNLNRLR